MGDSQPSIKRIDKSEFDKFHPARRPTTIIVSEEIEWYVDESKTLLGVVVWDRSDGDWAYIILGRDEDGKFRAIKLERPRRSQAIYVHFAAKKVPYRTALRGEIPERATERVTADFVNGVDEAASTIQRSMLPEDMKSQYVELIRLQTQILSRK